MLTPSGSVNNPTLSITWSSPSVPAGPITGYTLVRADGPGAQFTITLAIDPPTATSYTDVFALTPGEVYAYSLTAHTAGGSVTASPVQLRLADAVPVWGSGSAPIVTSTGSRSASVTFSAPERPNSASNSFSIIANATSAIVSSTSTLPADSATQGRATGLLPYTMYRVVVRVCNAAGCADSAPTLHRTDPDVPEGLAPPVVTRTATADTLQVSWAPCTTQNGVLETYAILSLYPPVSTLACLSLFMCLSTENCRRPAVVIRPVLVCGPLRAQPSSNTVLAFRPSCATRPN